MRDNDTKDFQYGLQAAKEQHGYVRLHEIGSDLLVDYAGLKMALIDIEQLTLVINDDARLRSEVRTVAANAIKRFVL